MKKLVCLFFIVSMGIGSSLFPKTTIKPNYDVRVVKCPKCGAVYLLGTSCTNCKD